jgi:hypothetical protein
MRLPCHRVLSVQRCGARAFAGPRGLPSPFPLRRASSFASTRAKGDALEDRVAALLRLEGVPPSAIRRNVIVKDANGNRSEIDLVYRTRPWWLGGRLVYVECKNYGSGPSTTGKSSSPSSSSSSSASSSVPLEDVAKFKAVLALLNVSPRQGLFVANGSYTPRATTIGIRTVDGRQLLDWERRARRRHRARRGAGLLAGTVAAGVALLAGGVAFSPDLSAAFDREMGVGRSAGGLWDGGGDDDNEGTVRRLVPASARAAAADGIAWLLARRGEWIRGWDEGRALQPLPGGFGSRWGGGGGGGGEWGAASSPPSSPSFLSSIAAFVRPLLPFVSAPPSASVAGRLGRAAGEASAGAEASLAEALRVLRKGVGG